MQTSRASKVMCIREHLVCLVWFQPYLWMKPQVVIRCIRDAIQNTSLVYTFDRILKSFSMLSSSFPFSKLYSNISKIEAADCGLPCPQLLFALLIYGFPFYIISNVRRNLQKERQEWYPISVFSLSIWLTNRVQVSLMIMKTVKTLQLYPLYISYPPRHIPSNLLNQYSSLLLYKEYFQIYTPA